jgi:hypothetical protein
MFQSLKAIKRIRYLLGDVPGLQVCDAVSLGKQFPNVLKDRRAAIFGARHSKQNFCCGWIDENPAKPWWLFTQRRSLILQKATQQRHYYENIEYRLLWKYLCLTWIRNRYFADMPEFYYKELSRRIESDSDGGDTGFLPHRHRCYWFPCVCL